MARTLTIQLPDEIYQAVQRLADRSGKPPEAVAVEDVVRHVATQSVPTPPAPDARERVRRHFGVVNTGASNSSDNARIDADLARQYASEDDPPPHP